MASYAERLLKHIPSDAKNGVLHLPNVAMAECLFLIAKLVEEAMAALSGICGVLFTSGYVRQSRCTFHICAVALATAWNSMAAVQSGQTRWRALNKCTVMGTVS